MVTHSDAELHTKVMLKHTPASLPHPQVQNRARPAHGAGRSRSNP